MLFLTSLVSSSVKLSKGIFIGKSCVINANTKIGKGSIIIQIHQLIMIVK